MGDDRVLLIMLELRAAFDISHETRACSASAEDENDVWRTRGSLNGLAKLILHRLRRPVIIQGSMSTLKHSGQAYHRNQHRTAACTLPRQWSLITISQDNHSFHPMFPTDHCRLVSIFRRKVRWRSEHVTIYHTRITDNCRLT